MKLIKLTTPELIEGFFNGENSVSVEEPCKIVTIEINDGATIKTICENGANISINKGVVSIEILEAPLEDTEKSAKKKPSSKK